MDFFVQQTQLDTIKILLNHHYGVVITPVDCILWLVEQTEVKTIILSGKRKFTIRKDEISDQIILSLSANGIRKTTSKGILTVTSPSPSPRNSVQNSNLLGIGNRLKISTLREMEESEKVKMLKFVVNLIEKNANETYSTV